MEGYEKSIGLKTIWLTLIRRFEYLLFVFVPIALTTLIVTQFIMKKTYQSSAVVSIDKAFSATNFEKFKSYVYEKEVLDGASEKLQSEKGLGISASDIKGGISFTTPATTAVSCKFSFQSSKQGLVQPVMDILSTQVAEYAKAKGGDFAAAKVSSPASGPVKNSSENKYLLIGIAAGLVVALGMGFIDEIISDEVYDKKDVEMLGCEAFELEVSQLSKKMMDGERYGSYKI